MKELEFDEIVEKEFVKDDSEVSSVNIVNIINNLQLCTNNAVMLTNQYTEILTDDNIIYIMTRISQNMVFMQHFPEFYEKNENGESVINCQQNSPYHRYGVFKHILYSIENVGKDSIKWSSHDMKILKWTMLLHDIGKPFSKTINSEGNDSFAGHDDISVERASKILDRFDFDEQEKKLILTLIEYHDKYLNEGDLTYDNLSFLAKELDDQKDLFYLLIEVKIADNRAKSMEVYNKFMTVVGKYYDFANEYFSDIDKNKKVEIIEGKLEGSIITPEEPLEVDLSDIKGNRGIYVEGGSDEDLTEEIIEKICKKATQNQNIRNYYQPIIDVKKQEVVGFEIFYKILTDEDFSYKQILKKCKEFGKYDKLQQMLFLNSLDRFNEKKRKKNMYAFFNIDLKSYEAYVNKSRIFSLLQENKIVLEFNNFEVMHNLKINDMFKEIVKSKGRPALDNFGTSNRVLADLDQIEPKVIKYKLENVGEQTKELLKKLSIYCLAESIDLIVYNVDTKEEMQFVNDLKIRYIQGDYFCKPTEGMDFDEHDVKEKIEQLNDELITK